MNKGLYRDFINGMSISGLADKYKVSKMRVYKELAFYQQEISFKDDELDFLIDYCNKHIADCEEMTYSCSEENCKLLGVYDNLNWYEKLKNKLENLKGVK